MNNIDVKKNVKRIAMLSILFLQFCWMPSTNSNLSSSVFKTIEGVKPILGQRRAIIILADFLDMNFTINRSLIEQRASNITSYFSEVSYNRMLLEVDITNKTYTLAYNMSFYANQPEKLPQDCISQADQEVNFNSYDYFLVVYASELVNPRTYLYLNIQTDDEKTIDSCVILSEFHRVRSFCHEIGHLLGLPDLYSEAQYTQGDVGCWDLMGVSTISQEYDGPHQLSAWSRIKLCWINSSEIKTFNISDTRDTTMLSDLETSPEWGIKTKAIKVAVTTEIYYLVELRNQILSDRNLPSSGILIYRCDESASDEGRHSIMVMDTSIDDFHSFEERNTYSNAAFDDEKPVFCDPVNGIAIEIFSFHPTASLVTVYRQQKLHMLKLAFPESGILVSVDNRNYVSDENGEVAVIVLSGNHTITVTLPSSPFHANMSLRWSDGVTSNPRDIQVLSDTTFACFFLTGDEGIFVDYLPLTVALIIAVLVVGLIAVGVLIRRKRLQKKQ